MSSMRISPSTIASRNKEDIREDFPAPVLPTMPTLEINNQNRSSIEVNYVIEIKMRTSTKVPMADGRWA